MNYRKGFVTNSSSSCFIVSRDDVSKDKLKKILFEIVSHEREKYDLTPISYEDASCGDSVTFRYNINEATENNPLNDDGYRSYYPGDFIYTNHYIIKNNDCVRYDWDIIMSILKKYGIPWEYGYCD